MVARFVTGAHSPGLILIILWATLKIMELPSKKTRNSGV